jgi:hypothetical protein
VFAVYLTLGKQRKDETVKVSSAVTTEVTALAKHIMGAIDKCITIATGTRHVPQTHASYIVQTLEAEPTVYNAVADRIGLLPRPDATTQFYLRIAEAKAGAAAVQEAVKLTWAPGIGGPPPPITREIVLPIADSLTTALQLAQPIIRDARPAQQFERWVQQTTLKQIADCLATAKATFPEAESFQTPSQR